MFSPFRSPALRARRPAHPLRRADPPAGAEGAEAAGSAAPAEGPQAEGESAAPAQQRQDGGRDAQG